MNKIIKLFILLLILSTLLLSLSDTFPPSRSLSTPDDYITTPSDTFYCSPTGNNSTGNGSISTPWLDLRGASGISAGDIIMFRGGTYPTAPESWSDGSENQINVDGTSSNYIVFTTYENEIAYWEHDSVSFTFGGDYQVMLGKAVGDSLSFQFDGGASFDNNNDYCGFEGVYFKHGAEYGSNPAMITYPHNTYTMQGAFIRSCHFDSSRWNDAGGQGHRMVCIRLFTTQNIVIENNLFTDNSELYQGGCVYFKDATTNATVRNNTFWNCAGGISYCVQGNAFNGMSAYHNLSYNSTYFIYFISDLSNSTQLYVYENTCYNLNTAFLYYLNADNQSWTYHGIFRDNYIDGDMWELGWANPNDDQNIPDSVYSNIHGSAADTADVSEWTEPSHYYDDSDVEANTIITVNTSNRNIQFGDGYSGIGTGIGGANIGGATWGGADVTAPTGSITLAQLTDSLDWRIDNISADLDTGKVYIAISINPSGNEGNLILIHYDNTAIRDTIDLDLLSGTAYLDWVVVDTAGNEATRSASLLFQYTPAEGATTAVDSVWLFGK